MPNIIIRLVFNLAQNKFVNIVVRRLLKPFANILPYKFINNVPVVGEIPLELPDAKVITFVSDGRDSMASRIYWSGLQGFEPETIRLFWHLLKNSRTVFDVGAHVGLYALIAGVEDTHNQVYAFEPVPQIYKFLTRNIERNRANNVRTFADALTNYDGQATLYVPQTMRLTPSASILEGFRGNVAATAVPALQIDTFVSRNHIGSVDLIKIDAEGAESRVLRGAAQVLENDQPVIICEILKEYTDDSLESIFEGTSYKFFLITDEGLVHHEKIIGDETYFYKNYLFIPEDKIPGLLQGIKILRPAGVGT